MRTIPLPESAEARNKKRASLRRTGIFYTVCVVAFAALACALLIGMVVSVIVFEFKEDLAVNLLFILMGSFAGGAVALALAAFGMNVLSRSHRTRELDFRERCDGEESFFVGEGTLATFKENGICIHGEDGGERSIEVPYKEMRFFSVCTRRRPRERSEWSVVLEIPAHYLAKPGRETEGPALIQTDAKERLYEVLRAHGATLLGEERGSGEEKTFKPVAKFRLPNREKRKIHLFCAMAGAALAVGGIFAGIYWQPAAGAILGVVGVFLASRSAVSFARAQGVLSFYEEGMYWQDMSGTDCIFLKWEEIEKIETVSFKEKQALRVHCLYGAYHFPAVAGAEAYLREHRPEKFGEEA